MWHWQTCNKLECDECQQLINDGIIIACDFCDAVGHNESNGWHFVPWETDKPEVCCDDCYNKFLNGTK